MSEKKKQHYVPKFYLKFFSNNELKTHIGLYHFDSNKLIRNADLKNQSYENFFYGKDNNIEDNLGIIETQAAEELNKIISTNQFPKLKTDEYTTIWIFTLLQTARTKQKAKEANEMVSKTLKAILKYDKRFKDELDKIDFGLENPAVFNLKTVISTFDVARDLACKLIINMTEIPLITSDHPVIMYNQFLEKREFPGGKTGLATKGLQIFYPISPKHALVFYDSRVYKIGFKKRLTVETSNKEDINSLNLLQSLNCDEVIYFCDRTSDFYINQLTEKRAKYFKKDKTVINEYNEQKKADGSTSVLMHYYNENHDTKLKLSFIKETPHAKGYELTGFAAEIRDESLRYRNENR